MSVHSGTIGGDVGGRYVSLPVVAVHCDGCEDVYAVAPAWDDGTAREVAEGDGWTCYEDDLCPECTEKAQHAEASR